LIEVSRRKEQNAASIAVVTPLHGEVMWSRQTPVSIILARGDPFHLILSHLCAKNFTLAVRDFSVSSKAASRPYPPYLTAAKLNS
jgi:hypothetical protein